MLQVASALCLIASVNGGLVQYPNGAVVPYDPANQAATAAHLASKGYLGYASVYAHPVVHHQVWKREAEAGLVSYPNGAVVPYDPANQAATAAHLAYTGHLGYAGVYGYPTIHHQVWKREADPQVYAAALPYAYGYPYAYGVSHVSGVPLVAHPNGAVVPLEPAAVSIFNILLKIKIHDQDTQLTPIKIYTGGQFIHHDITHAY